MISLNLNNLTQAMVDEAMPHLGECKYTSPCLIGAMMTPDERQTLSYSDTTPIALLNLAAFPNKTQRYQATQIQVAFDTSDLARLHYLLPHLEFNQS